MSRLRRVVQLLNSNNKIVYTGAVGTVLPLAIISDAIDFLVQPNRAAKGNVGLSRWSANAPKICSPSET